MAANIASDVRNTNQKEEREKATCIDELIVGLHHRPMLIYAEFVQRHIVAASNRGV